jgi:hypothetical protein
VLILVLALAFAWFWRAWADPLGREIGGASNDSDGVMWFLAWVPHAIAHGHDPLLSNFLLYPHGINAMWNTSMTPIDLLLSPVTSIASVVVSYNLVDTLAPALSSWAAYLAFRRWTAMTPALLGGLVFGFSPFIAAESNFHPFLTLLVTAPLLLIVLDRLLVVQQAPAWRDGLWLGLLAWAQLLIAEEVLAMEAIAALAGLAGLICSSPRSTFRQQRLAHAIRGLTMAACIFLALSAVPLAMQFLGPYRLARPVHQSDMWVTDLLNFIAPTSMTALHTHASVTLSEKFPGNVYERGSYLGIPLLVFVVVALIVARRRRLIWAGFSMLLLLGLFSLGQQLHIAGRPTGIALPWAALARLPLLYDLLPSRLASLMFFGAGLIIALGFDELRQRRLPGRLAGWGLGMLALVSLIPVAPYRTAAVARPAAFVHRLACPRPRGAVAVVLPANDQEPLLWQVQSGFCFRMPTAAGMTQSSSIPKAHWSFFMRLSLAATYGASLPALTPANRARAQQALSGWHARVLVLGPQPPYGRLDACRRLASWLTALLGPPTQRIGTSLVWRHPNALR